MQPLGAVRVSTDGAATWQRGAGTGVPVQAVAVGSADDGVARIAVVTTEAVLLSEDDGQTFEALTGL